MTFVLLFVISFVAAFVFALGGVGAAIVLIPILVFLGVPLDVAKPIGLFYNVVSLSSATLNNFKNQRLEITLGLPIIISSLVFAVLGAWLSRFVPTRWVLFLFTIFLVFSALLFLFQNSKTQQQYRTSTPLALLFFIGGSIGTLSGLLGIGGGSLLLPLMLLLGFNPKKITTITAFVVPFSSFSGFLTYWAMGYIDWPVLGTVSLAGIGGATLGTIVLHKKLEANKVKKILAIILLLVAVKLLLNLR